MLPRSVVARSSLRALVALLGPLPACSPDAVPATSTDGGHPSTGPQTDCATCHPTHVKEWSLSPHAYAMHDPVFQAMVRLGQRETKGELGDFCVKCHTPIGAETGQTPVTLDAATGEYVQPTSGLETNAMDGVSCLVCHSITEVTGPSNANFVMKHDGVRRGPIRDPEPNPSHRSAFSDLQAKSKFCGGCHVVVNPKGVALEETNTEWVQSRFNGTQDCQACHMRSREAPAAVGHRKRTVHDHTFAGADVSLLPEDRFPGYEELRRATVELLQTSVNLSVTASPTERAVGVHVENLAGHALPSGATADREMWIELIVRDDSGGTAFESGTLDEHGDLRVADPERTTSPGTDPSLALYSQDMLFDPKLADATSTEPARRVDFLWEPNTKADHMIHVHGIDHRSYDVSALPPGSYTAAVRLLFRSFPPHLLRKLEELAGLDPEVKARVPTVEMATASIDFTL